MKYLILFIWIELILLFSLGCSAPKERRGDWMEHLNYRQFSFKPIDLHWQKNYHSIEELKVMWEERYQVAIQNLERGADE